MMNNRLLKLLGWSLVLAITLGAGILIGRTFGPASVLAESKAPTASPQAAALQTNEAEPGILIAGVVPDSPAAEAGVVRGDILLEINGETVNQFLELRDQLTALQADDTVELKVQHGDDELDLTATLTNRNGIAYLGVIPCMDHQLHLNGMPSAKAFGFRAAEAESGARVVQIEADSSAAEAGLQEGDLITAIDGEPLDNNRALVELIADHEPGDSLELTVERDGEATQSLTVTLGEHPDQAEKAYLGVRVGPSFTIRQLQPGDLPDAMPRWHTMPFEGVEGTVSIQQVAEDSPAAEAGLTEGDTIIAIDDEPVTNPRQVIELVQSHEPGDTLTLTIKKAGDETETTVEVTIGEDPDQADAPYLGVALGYMFHMMGPDGETIFEMAPGMRLAPNFEFHRRDVKPFDGTIQITPDSGDFDVMIWTEDGSL